MTSDQVSAIEQRIGARVLIARNRRHLSARQLASMAQVSQNTIYRLESGIGCCSIGTLYLLAVAMKMELTELLP
jgi:transcriptional regulator with XRE-family HTH domain